MADQQPGGDNVQSDGEDVTIEEVYEDDEEEYSVEEEVISVEESAASSVPDPTTIQTGEQLWYITDTENPRDMEPATVVKAHFEADTGYYFTIAIQRGDETLEKQTVADRLRKQSAPSPSAAAAGAVAAAAAVSADSTPSSAGNTPNSATNMQDINQAPQYAMEHQQQQVYDMQQQQQAYDQVGYEPPTEEEAYYYQQQQLQQQQQDAPEYFQDEEQPPVLYQPQPVRAAETTSKTKGSTVASSIEKENSYLCWGLVVACLLLAVALGGTGVVLYFWIDHENDNDSVDVRVTSITPAPTTASPVAPGSTPAPVTPSPVTPQPTPAPGVKDWTITTAGTTPRGEPTELGSSLAMAGTNYLVTGEPRFGANYIKPGQLVPFERSGAGQSFVDQGILVDDTEMSLERFGSAVDMILDASTGLPVLAVGAMRTKGLERSNDRFGAGFYYEYDSVNGTYVPVGGTLRGGESLGETGGLLGYAVALAQLNGGTKRMAVSSPSSSVFLTVTLDVGRIYTYELLDNGINETQWLPMTAEPLMGEASSFLGASIDLSSDGSALVAGAPGSLPADGTAGGSVFVYRWNDVDGTWDSVTVTDNTGVAGTESLGSAVQWIGVTDEWFAVGAPTANANAGMVRVYQRNIDGTYAPLGSDIVGTAENDGIGTVVCGRNGRLATGNANTGSFAVYEYNGASNAWDVVGSTFTPVDGTAVVACAMSDDGNTLAVGTATFQIVVYDLM